MKKNKLNSNNTILVTGGAGYIGSHTVKELIKNGYDVVVVDSLESGHLWAVDKKAKFEKSKLEDIFKIKKIFKKYSPIAVIDFAAYLAVGESMLKPTKYFQNNVDNFINLLNVMVLSNCKYLIKSSTAAVYGNPAKKSDIPWKEEFTEKYKPRKSALLPGMWTGKEISGDQFLEKFINLYRKKISNNKKLVLKQSEISKLKIPLSIYGVSKLLDEIVMKKYDELFEIKSIALRYFNVSGADASGKIGDAKPIPTNLMSLAIFQLINNSGELSVFGDDYPTPDGTGVRDYIHPSDLASAHNLALEYLFKNSKSNVFNLATGVGSSVLDVIRSVEKVSKRKINFSIADRRSGDPAISIADPKKAKKILNWKTKHTLEDMSRTAWKFANKKKKK